MAIFIATHVGLRIQLQKYSSSTRANKANGVAIFEGSPIRYISAVFIFFLLLVFSSQSSRYDSAEHLQSIQGPSVLTLCTQNVLGAKGLTNHLFWVRTNLY